MKVSKRIFDLETESAFTILAKANKLTTRNIVFLNNGANEGIRTPDIGHHKPAL